ncbi:MAG: hypothetical protein JWM27_4818 [Gemmatimonadetes bacterium]|nr:hypothetical protein [Gemmatimonadota bacterium]
MARELAGTNSFAVAAARPETLPHVHRSLALGVARVGDEYQLAVRVQRSDLMGSALLEHIRRAACEEVDIRFIGRVDKRRPPGGGRRIAAGNLRLVSANTGVPAWYRSNTRPLQIGASVGHVNVTAGTLGAFVSRGGVPHILSNNHVLADEDRAARGDPVLQRAAYDGGSDPADAVGVLAAAVKLKRKAANLVDAALARMPAHLPFDPTLLKGIVSGANRVLTGVRTMDLDISETVFKIGRTTGPTRGRVVAIEVDGVVATYGIGNLRFDGQVEIEGVGDRPFSDGGDSGSLIVDEEMRAMGLLFAGSDTGGTNGLGLTYANPIHTVLTATGAQLLL